MFSFSKLKLFFFFGFLFVCWAEAKAQDTLLDHVRSRVGTWGHPIGSLTAWTRCDFSNVYNHHLILRDLKLDADLGSEKTLKRLEAGIDFFNQVARVNDFYSESLDLRIHPTVQFPSRFYNANGRVVFRKGEYETTKNFEQRYKDYESKVRTQNVYYILARHVIGGKSMIPRLNQEMFVKYNADGEYFNIDDISSFERREWQSDVWWDSNNIRQEKTEEFNVGVSTWESRFPHTKEEYIKIAESVRAYVSRDRAPSVHSYIVIVVEAQQQVFKFENEKEREAVLVPISLEMRDICTNEVLVHIVFSSE